MTYSARLTIVLAIVLHCCYTPVGAQQSAKAAPCVIALRAVTLWAPRSSDGERGPEARPGVAMTTTPARPGTYYGHNYLQMGGKLVWTAGPHSTVGEICAMTNQWIIQAKPGDGISRYGACTTPGGAGVPSYKFVLVP
jgi:hypothetical protein